jgi:hypothetical protein
MADTTAPPGSDDSDDAERFDTEAFDDVQASLNGAPHLRPDSELPDVMPDWVWDRLSATLAAEAAARAAETHDNVVLLGAAGTGAGTAATTATSTPRSESHPFRWVGGLVAASVAILAITVGVQVTGGSSSSGDLVAGEAVRSIPTSLAKIPSPAAGAAELGAAPLADTSAAAEAPAPTTDQPAKMVIDSNTQYTEAGLTGQVTTLLDRIDVHSAREAALMPPKPIAWPVEDGFTASWSSLRDCLSWLAKSPRAQALVVDRGTFEGAEAGVIVIPADQVDADVTPPPTATVESSLGTMDVWVVDPACQQEVDSIIKHLPYIWPR